ncbi:hypothetical protein [Brasilonema sp. UFV-L1]|uniref:hypothetical protein n=1 Tax=Brasilonema sp. UFV-L1 TaxID=2234130 RepID=UPI00145E6125|nr:hypothetical protein [Brasilonema sp. UFV-L1]NMG06285.1 hypothetical protein [Brasilonema sp. UFV-L1]
MNAASQYLLKLAKRNVEPYISNPKAQAAMVTGSAAEGLADCYSDLDMIIYYDELPSPEELQVARQQNQGSEVIWVLGERTQGEVGEAYYVNGVECQIGNITIVAWEREMAKVLQELDVTSPMQKALSGVLNCIPLYNEELIKQWQAKIAHYPDALAQAMVETHLQFFPVWKSQERLLTRDTTVWFHQVLVESVQNILAILAGINKLYYSTFQFKRMGMFIDKMNIVPENLSMRMESLFQSERRIAIRQLEDIIRETLELVNLHMPQVDTSKVQEKLGMRQQPWKLII